MAAGIDDFAPYIKDGDGWDVLVPHATNQLAFRPVKVACGATGGTIVAVDAEGKQATFSVVAGQVLAIRPVRIDPSSTATPLIGLKR